MWAALISLGVLATFHRPLIFRGTKWLAVRLAREQKLTLVYEIDGTIFTTLRIKHLNARPVEPGPIERLEIGEIELRYSLVDVIRHGLPALLKEVEVHDAWVVLNPAQSVPRGKPPVKRTKFPAVFPERLKLTDLHVRIRSPDGDTELAGLSVDFNPVKPGELEIQILDIPGVRRWTNVTARTAVHDRQLVLSDLVAGPEIALKQLSLDASRLDERRLGLGFEGNLFDGTATLKATITDLNRSNRLEIRAEAAHVSLSTLSHYLRFTPFVDGSIVRMKLDVAGVPARPAEWSGNADLGLSGLVYNQATFGTANARVEMANGRITLAASSEPGGGNRLTLDAAGELPATLDGFWNTTATGRLDLAAVDLSELPGPAVGPVAGDLTARIDVRLGKGRGAADMVLSTSRLAIGDFEATNSKATIHAESDLKSILEYQPFAAMATQMQASAAATRWRHYESENLALAMTTRGNQVTLERLTLEKGANAARFEGSYAFPDDFKFKRWDEQMLRGTVEIDAPELGALVAEASGVKTEGALKVNGDVSMVGGSYTGRVSSSGHDIRFNGLAVRAAEAEFQLSDGMARMQKFEVVFDDLNRLAADGQVSIEAPHAYNGSMSATLAELAILQPALQGIGRIEPLAGSLALSWTGSGEWESGTHSGEGTVDLTNGRFGDHKGLAAHVVTEYSPQAVHVPECRLAAGPYHGGAVIEWENGMARVNELTVSRRTLRLVEGHAELPLQWTKGADLGQLLSDDGPVNIGLRSRDLNLTSLFNELGEKKPPVAGIIDMELAAQGRLRDLTASATIHATGLQAAAAKKFAPATAVLDVNLRNNRLTAKGLVRQPQVAPLEITASMPFEVSRMKNQRVVDPDWPLEAHVRLPRSSLDFVPALVPKIRALKGTLAVDVEVAGTVNSPVLTGSAEADVAFLRFTDSKLPPVNDASLRLGFTRDQATIRGLAGRIAGGSFNAGGTVQFSKLSEPVFDIRLSTSNALVMQNDNLTARANSHLTLKGGFHTATLAGTVALTQSRFFKDVEILPIGLPGRPAPKPPAAPTRVSFPNLPVRDWKFDVTIKTADPFLIQGNLANGRGVIDLKLKGTGLEPWIEGEVRTESLMTSLPFSRLDVTSGRAAFSVDNPFEPTLNIRATSMIRDYQIDVYVFGSPSSPQAVFSSQPPLPQSDIVSLLATGTTAKELSEDPNILAGRAATLVFKKYYHKFFKKNEPFPAEESIFSHVQFEVGAVDPKSGRESVAVRVPLTDEIVLTGGVDVGGDFRGQIKYLVRFR